MPLHDFPGLLFSDKITPQNGRGAGSGDHNRLINTETACGISCRQYSKKNL